MFSAAVFYSGMRLVPAQITAQHRLLKMCEI
jgi:hypothetical protein